MKSFRGLKNDELLLSFSQDCYYMVEINSEIFKHSSILHKNSAELLFKENFFYQIISNLFNRGCKLKSSVIMFEVFKKFYFVSCHTSSKSLDLYYFWREYQYNMGLNFYVYNIMFLINWVVLTLKPVFNIQCQIVPKKYRKHLKTSYLYKIKYLQEKKRFKVALKWISVDVLNSSYKLNIDKIFATLIDLILNFKKSKSYQNKLKIYSYLLKIK